MKKLKLNKNSKIGLIIGIIILIIILIVLVKNNMSNLEKDLLKEKSNTIMLYMDSVENTDSKEIDKYILYALEYSFNEKNKESLSSKEIKKLIESIFDIKVSTKEINSIGITPLLLDKNVIHDPEKQVYSIDRSNITQRQIADIPIITYSIKSIKKRGSKYIVKYNKATIDNPYEILNYYSDLNNPVENDSKNKKQEQKKTNTYDTSKIMNYLTTKGKIKDVKLAVNEEVIKKSGSIDKKIVSVTYKLNGTKFVVAEVK